MSVREVTAVSKKPETGEVLKKFSAKIERKDFFYKTPVIKALKYFEDGIESDVKKYDTREIEPFYPVFDKNGKKNYKLEIAGDEVVDRIKCLKIKVVPLKNSIRHFSGEIFVDPEKLELVRMKGTVAKLHWAMKKYDFDYFYKDLNGFPAIVKGRVIARVKVFLVVSDNTTTYEINVLSNQLY